MTTVNKQFISTDKILLSKEFDFWKTSMMELFNCYEQACRDILSPDGRELKAFHAARVAGFSHALTAHMSACVETLVGADPDSSSVKACIDSAERLFNKAMKHHNSQEALAGEVQS